VKQPEPEDVAELKNRWLNSKARFQAHSSKDKAKAEISDL